MPNRILLLDFFNLPLPSRVVELINLAIVQFEVVDEKVLFDKDSGLNPAHGAFIAKLA